jgi:UDP-N-acetylglucosamine 2-epimerase (non-hydrolysing)
VVLTDSGGVQEECPSLGVPVLVTRKTTERPEAVDAGYNFLVGTDREEVLSALRRHLQRPARRPGTPPLPNPYGDGRASDRIRRAVLHRLGLEERPGEFKPVTQPGSALSGSRRGERVAEGELP